LIIGQIIRQVINDLIEMTRPLHSDAVSGKRVSRDVVMKVNAETIENNFARMVFSYRGESSYI